MKICPNCKEEVEDNFDMCWNCQYSFSASKVLKCSEFNVVCPACYAEIDRKLRFCPYCKFDLTKNSEIGRPKIPGTVKKIDCLRCQVPMSYNGNFRFHEGMHVGGVAICLSYLKIGNLLIYTTVPNVEKLSSFCLK